MTHFHIHFLHSAWIYSLTFITELLKPPKRIFLAITLITLFFHGVRNVQISQVRLRVNKADLCWGFCWLLTLLGFGSLRQHSSRGLLWILSSFNALWRPFRLHVFPPAPASTTHWAQMCSPDAHGRALPGGVKDNLKTNGGVSINTWSQDGKEAFPGLTSQHSITSPFMLKMQWCPVWSQICTSAVLEAISLE